LSATFGIIYRSLCPIIVNFDEVTGDGGRSHIEVALRPGCDDARHIGSITRPADDLPYRLDCDHYAPGAVCDLESGAAILQNKIAFFAGTIT